MTNNDELALNGTLNKLTISVRAILGLAIHNEPNGFNFCSLQHKQQAIAQACKDADALKSVLKSL